MTALERPTLLARLAARQLQRRFGRRRRTTAVVAVAAGAAGAVLAGGAAYAYWTSTGSGNGTANVGSAIALTVTPTNLSGLYPTEKTTVPVSVTNTNPYPVTLSSITLDGVTPTGSGCLATDVTLDSSAPGVSGTTYTISGSLTKAGGSAPTTNFNVPIVVAQLADGCQGAGHSFSLSLTIHGQSA